MSYIIQGKRGYIDVSPIGNCCIESTDELSYAIMSLINNYLKNQDGKLEVNSTKSRQVVGTLEGVKHEFIRTFVTPEAIQDKYDNGDLY